MRETRFIRQNQDKWRILEIMTESGEQNPDQLYELFIQVTDDLSYARTFYPNRSVRVFLNGLAQQLFYRLYRSQRLPLRRIARFWTDELPLLMYHAVNEFRLSLLIFSLALSIGWLSSAHDPAFPRLILGDDYVDMTIRNIESGDPMAVYKQGGAWGMSLGITANNLFVAFITFIFGLLFSVGTAALLLQNGIMIGAFLYFFYERGLLGEASLTIWQHGTLEISAIIIAGAAGLTLGKGLLLPGTYARLQAFQQSARRGLKIMIGIAPVIILAGFVEGFLTRYTALPAAVRVLLIVLSLAFVLAYFVWYPRIKARQLGFPAPENAELPPDRDNTIDFGLIRSSGVLLSDVFVFFRTHFRPLLTTAVLGTTGYCVIAFWSGQGKPMELFEFPSDSLGGFTVFRQFFVNDRIPLLSLAGAAMFLPVFRTVATRMAWQAAGMSGPIPPTTGWGWLKITLGAAAFFLLLSPGGFLAVIALILAAPAVLLWTYCMCVEQKDPLRAMMRTFLLLGGGLEKAVGLFLLLLCIGLLLFVFLDSALLWFFFNIVKWTVSIQQGTLDQMLVVTLTFLSVLLINILSVLFMAGAGLLYYTLLEIREAPGLQARLDQLGHTPKRQGLRLES